MNLPDARIHTHIFEQYHCKFRTYLIPPFFHLTGNLHKLYNHFSWCVLCTLYVSEFIYGSFNSLCFNLYKCSYIQATRPITVRIYLLSTNKRVLLYGVQISCVVVVCCHHICCILFDGQVYSHSSQ